MVRFKEELFVAAQAFGALIVLGLVALGVAGTIYKVISPEGWIVQLLGRSLFAGAAVIGSLVVIIALAWVSSGRSAPRRRIQVPEALVYCFAAAGVLYIGQFWGTF